MDAEAFHNLIRGRRRGPLAWFARRALGLASVPYGWGVAWRNRRFDRHPETQTRVAVPVVSVGNITLGGTGKTPLVEWVARWYRERDRRVALLSRGYGAEAGLNDEGLVLDQNLPDVPHLQDPHRVRIAQIAIEELESELLILDDGFQHRKLHRDLDLVLLDALDPFGLGRLFPRGLLREPIHALRRANVVILSRADLVDSSTRLAIRAEAERRSGGLRWAEARHAPRDLIDCEAQSQPLSDLDGRRVFAFCGIGNPQGFRETLARIGVEPLGFHSFRDHHPYSRADVENLRVLATRSGADLVLTTQKDLVKLRVRSLGPLPLRALRIKLEFLSGQSEVEAALSTLLRDQSTAPGSP